MDDAKFTYIAVYNGAEQKGCWLRLRRLVKALAASGNVVHLVVPSCFEVSVISGVCIWKSMPFKSKVNSTGLRKIGNSLAGALWASFLVRSVGRNTIGIAFDSHNALFFAFSTKMLSKLLFIRGETQYQATLNEPPVYSIWMRLLDRSLKRISDSIIVNNYKALSTYKSSGYNTTLLRNDTQVPTRSRINEPKAFTIGYCGQINERKNLSLLISAFKEIDRPDVRMLVQGAGKGYRSILRAASEDYRITLKSWRRTTDNFYNSIDLFVLPSLFDDFSNAALDAMAHGVPVLISSRGGSSEMVCQDPAFIFDPNGGPGALVEKILYIKNNYKSLCRRVSSIVEHYRFDWESEAERTILRLSSDVNH